MAELMVVGFKQDVRRASEVLELLGRSSPDWAVDLRDALAREVEAVVAVAEGPQGVR